MKEIYFPEFQIRDESYLKLALLYKESISPIIPSHYEKRLPDVHGIRAHTNLFKNIDLLSVKEKRAIELTGQEIIFLLQMATEQPDLFRIREDFPGHDNTNKTLLEYLRASTWSYRLVEEKVNWPLWDYIKQEGLGKEGAKEIEVSPLMGYLYMNRLAANLSDTLGNDYILSSVDKNYRHYQEVLNAIQFRITPDYLFPQKEQQLKRRVLTQLLPKNLHEIPMASFVALRGQESYVKDLIEYNAGLDAYIMSTEENGVGSEDLLRRVRYYEPYLHDKVRTALKVGSVLLPAAIDILYEEPAPWLNVVSNMLPVWQLYSDRRESSGLSSENKRALKNLVHHLNAIT